MKIPERQKRQRLGRGCSEFKTDCIANVRRCGGGGGGAWAKAGEGTEWKNHKGPVPTLSLHLLSPSPGFHCSVSFYRR